MYIIYIYRVCWGGHTPTNSSLALKRLNKTNKCTLGMRENPPTEIPVAVAGGSHSLPLGYAGIEVVHLEMLQVMYPYMPSGNLT